MHQQLATALEGIVRTLAVTIGERNTQKYDALVRAEEYIREHLQERGYREVQNPSYEVDGVVCSNVEAELVGSDIPEEIIVIGAHYDSIRGGVGANDNASGVASLLSLARLLRDRPLKRTMRFVAFVNEEEPYTYTSNMGSVVYAKRSRERNENIKLMISLETMGFYPDKSKIGKYESRLRRLILSDDQCYLAFVSNLRSKTAMQKLDEGFKATNQFPTRSYSVPGFLPGVKSSDHWSFWQEAYPAVMVTDTAWVRYPFYHRSEDTPEKLDYGSLSTVVEGLADAITHVANR